MRHLLAGYDLNRDKRYGHVTTRKGRTEFLAFCRYLRYLRSLHPAEARIAIVLDNFSPHLSTKTTAASGTGPRRTTSKLAYVPFYGSWLNRIEAHSPR